MSNPFLDKSPSQLKAMVPGLSDPELDALCAKYCDGYEVRPAVLRSGRMNYAVHRDGQWQREPPSYTSDGREAMRLLVKYHVPIPWKDCFSVEEVCRAIAEAAVITALEKLIEGDGAVIN